MKIRTISPLLWFVMWMLLSWPPSVAKALSGIAVAAFVTFMTGDILKEVRLSVRNPSRYLWFAWYAVVFIWECFKANIDVACRVIHPDLPIRPGTIKIKTGLRSNIALTFFANSITLTPGTTTIDIDKEKGVIYVHRIHINESDPSAGLAVAEKFERILRKVFE